MTSATALITTAGASEFLFREAHLLDTHDYDAWLDLWAEDGFYWMPCDGSTDPDKQVAVLADNKRRLAMRVKQLQTGYRYAQLPQSNTAHYITNIRVSEGAEPDQVRVDSSYLVIEARFGDIQLWPGHVTHLLRVSADDRLMIVRKSFTLINQDLPIPTMGFLP
jgi:benzoate/toluate 1,2-dioxygenase beta subunit